MGLFGERFDRKFKHHQVIEHKRGDTGREIEDRVRGRIKGKEITKRKILQQNLYRKHRGHGHGIWKSYKMAKARASEIMLKKHERKHHHKHR